MIVAHIKDGYATTDTNRDVKAGDELFEGETVEAIENITISIQNGEELSISQGDSFVLDRSVISTQSIVDEANLSPEQLISLNLAIGDSFEVSFNEDIDFANIQNNSTELLTNNFDIHIDDLIETQHDSLNILSEDKTEQSYSPTQTDRYSQNSSSQDLPELLSEEDFSLFYTQG